MSGWRIWRAGLALLAGLVPVPLASASWLDSDFYCRVYGCVIVHDGRTFDVYDNYIFATGGTVGPGGKMIAWSGNPFQGLGAVNPVFTGTRDEGFHIAPLTEEGTLLGIDQTGNGEIDLSASENAQGFLDASSMIGAFELDGSSRLVARETSAQRSFYLSSRTGFSLRARSRLLGSPSGLNDPALLSKISFAFDIRRSGRDDGMNFGQDAANGNFFRFNSGVDDLGDIYGSATQIVEFTREIRRRASDDLPRQSIRFDYVYGFEAYDLSMGAGHLRYTIEFDFFNR